MGLFSRIGKTKDKLGNAVKTWADFDRHKEVSENLKSRIADLLQPAEPTREETFEDAKSRFHLTEADLDAIATRYTMIAYLLLAWACVVFGYSVYHMLGHFLKGMVVSWGVTALLLAVSFRYHFWAFQIKQRRLGCTFRDWLTYTFLGKKP